MPGWKAPYPRCWQVGARPIVGVPVSVGYGVSAGSQAALSGMLASCAPGLVVNIDNGWARDGRVASSAGRG